MSVTPDFPAARDDERDLRLRAMFEGAAIGIGICRLDGQILEANPALARTLGYSQEELAGEHSSTLCWDGQGETSGAVGSNDSSAALPQGKPGLGQASSGEQRFGELGKLMRGERDSFEVARRFRRKDGSDLDGQLTMSLGRDARRQPAFLIATLADAKLPQRVEEGLRTAEKMEVIGRLAGGIAHDFNNLLTGILLCCDLLTAGLSPTRPENAVFENGGLEGDGPDNGDFRNFAPGNRTSTSSGSTTSGSIKSASTKSASAASDLCQHVDEVRMAGEQGAALTRQLLAIARKQVPVPEPIAINAIVASTENLLRRLLGEQIALVIGLDPTLDSDPGFVLADPAEMRQILLNLVLNARDAMPQGGKIKVSTKPAEFRRAELQSQSPGYSGPVSAGRSVALTVEDDGCGMNSETRERLFEAFFTTKNPGQGTGLGLAMVRRIVDRAGGTIEVESAAGRGTCIAVHFPALEPATDILNLNRRTKE